MFIQTYPSRRYEILFLAALLVLAVTLVVRYLQPQPAMPVTISVDAPAPRELSDEYTVVALQERIRSNPDDTDAYAFLGLALLQQVRETADPALYSQAEQSFAEALKRDPQHLEALIGQGSLDLSRHQFAAALRRGEQARAINPYRAQVYGIIGDAQVELGRYEEAMESIQKMVDTRPSLSSYSRVAYLRELQGDREGAIEAMQRAITAGNPASAETRWVQMQLGHLYFNQGDLAQAEQIYAQILSTRADDVFALGGIARIRAAQGKYAEAIDLYRQISIQHPLPEFVIALGDLYMVTGQPEEAERQYDLVRAIQQLHASAGVRVDLELALFEADHSHDPPQTVKRAREAYAQRPNIFAADALAWALYGDGQYTEAQRYSQEALRLGTRDALLYYHAGLIAYALEDYSAAREYLQQALAINPYFSLRYAPAARELVQNLAVDSER